MENDIIVDLGENFDRWVDWRIKTAQYEVARRIDANFDFAWRLRLFNQTGMMLQEGEKDLHWKEGRFSNIKPIKIKVSPGLMSVIEHMEYKRDLLTKLSGIPKN